MKTSIKIAAALTAVAALGFAIAAPTLADGWKRGGNMMGQMGNVVFEKFDADADGKVTRTEANSYIASQISTYDSDTSNGISLQEFEGIWMEQTKTPMVRAFQRLDADGDGNLTQAEVESPIDRIFARADRNDDDAIERSEMRMGKNRGQHRDGRGKGGNAEN